MSDETSFAISCNGVAFHCFTSLNTLKRLGQIGEEITVYTFLHVREDALTLYAFSHPAELETFEIITTVSGVGPKVGIGILSEFTPDELAMSIISEDVKTLTRAPGIGAKTAQRIILELRDKMSTSSISSAATQKGFGIGVSAVNVSNFSEAIDALMVLGYSQTEAAMAVKQLDENLSTEDLIKSALKILAGQAK